MPTPWIEKHSFLSRLPYLCYDTFVVIIVGYMLVLDMYYITTAPISFQDLCVLGITDVVYLCGLLVTVHQRRFRSQLKRLTDNMDAITGNIMRSELGGAEIFKDLYEKNSKLMAYLTNGSLILCIMSPSMYYSSVPAMDIMAGIYRTNTPRPIVMPFEYHVPVLYELVMLLVNYSVAISASQKTATDCLFISLFNIQITFLKYVSVAKKSLEKELLNADDFLIRRKLIIWTKLHQDILRNMENLIEIFSPVIIIYYVTIINIVVCGAFVQLKRDDDNFIQSGSIGSYVIVTIIYFFLLSNTAHQLTSEAEKLSFRAYSLPWYAMDKSNATTVMMVIIKSNTPMNVTAFREPSFVLNRESFAGFMVRVVSAFVTFCQMKELYD